MKKANKENWEKWLKANNLTEKEWKQAEPSFIIMSELVADAEISSGGGSSSGSSGGGRGAHHAGQQHEL